MGVTYETDHRQVHLIVGNRFALVDEGMSNIIRVLWEADVGTNFSCQGGPQFGGYIQTDLREVWPALFKAITKRGLSPQTKAVRLNFLKGIWEFMYWPEKGKTRSIVLDDGTTHYDSKIGLRIRKMRSHQRHCVEFSYHRFHGFRFVLRWPTEQTPAIEQFLSEVLERRK